LINVALYLLSHADLNLIQFSASLKQVADSDNLVISLYFDCEMYNIYKDAGRL